MQEEDRRNRGGKEGVRKEDRGEGEERYTSRYKKGKEKGGDGVKERKGQEENGGRLGEERRH